MHILYLFSDEQMNRQFVHAEQDQEQSFVLRSKESENALVGAGRCLVPQAALPALLQIHGFRGDCVPHALSSSKCYEFSPTRDEDPTFFSMNQDPDPAQLGKNPDTTLNRNEKNIFIYFKQVCIKFDLINQHFKLEFVDSGFYFVQDENNFMNLLLKFGNIIFIYVLGSCCNFKGTVQLIR